MAWLGLLVVSIAFLLALRRMHEDLDRANADPARRNAATNAPSASLDR